MAKFVYLIVDWGFISKEDDTVLARLEKMDSRSPTIRLSETQPEVASDRVVECVRINSIGIESGQTMFGKTSVLRQFSLGTMGDPVVHSIECYASGVAQTRDIAVRLLQLANHPVCKYLRKDQVEDWVLHQSRYYYRTSKGDNFLVANKRILGDYKGFKFDLETTWEHIAERGALGILDDILENTRKRDKLSSALVSIANDKEATQKILNILDERGSITKTELLGL